MLHFLRFSPSSKSLPQAVPSLVGVETVENSSFSTPKEIMSASVERDSLTRIGSPRKLFGTGLRPDPIVNQYAVTADGRKFLLLEPQKDYLQTYSVILNWPEALK